MGKTLNNITTYSVVIPVYCEGPNLKKVLLTINQYLDSLNETYEIVIVDDGSTDNTWTLIQELSETLPMVRAVRLSRNFGKEAALCAGLEIADGKAVIVMDGDLQHPPEIIPEMTRLWCEERADVVEAVKISRGKETLMNKIGSKLFYIILNKLTGYDLTGMTDFKLMDRRVIDAWRKMDERTVFFRGMSAWLGFKRMKIPFTVPERVVGSSKWSVFRLIKLAITGVTAFSSLPLYLINLVGIGFLLFAVILGVQSLFLKITGEAVTGFTTVNLLLLIIGSILMIGLGIIGEYIAKIYEEIKRRPRYIVAQTINKKSKKIAE